MLRIAAGAIATVTIAAGLVAVDRVATHQHAATGRCHPAIRTTTWTGRGPATATDAARAILALGIHAPTYQVHGGPARAIGLSPLGSLAVRRTAPRTFAILGLTVIARHGCERQAAQQALARLNDFAEPTP